MNLKLMSYNVHSCHSPRGRDSLSLVSQIIREAHPTVIGLQELDIRCRRSGGVDQLEALQNASGMRSYFAPLVELPGPKGTEGDKGLYGIGFLVSNELDVVEESLVPLPKLHERNEPRAILKLVMQSKQSSVCVLNTHLGLQGRERLIQTEHIAAFIEHQLRAHENVCLMGDFNAVVGSTTRRRLSECLNEAHLSGFIRGTFPSRFPLWRLDGIYSNHSLREYRIVFSKATRQASDHLPVTGYIEV